MRLLIVIYLRVKTTAIDTQYRYARSLMAIKYGAMSAEYRHVFGITSKRQLMPGTDDQKPKRIDR